MAFLIGQNMTGGYGGADILHDCTIGVEKGEIAVAAQTPLYTFAAGWQGFLKHYSLTRHVYQTALIMYSKEF